VIGLADTAATLLNTAVVRPRAIRDAEAAGRKVEMRKRESIPSLFIQVRSFSAGLALLSILLLSGCAGTQTLLTERPSYSEWLLQVCDDEESLEKRIATYFREKYDVEAEYLFLEEDDLYLQYHFTSDEGHFPDMAVFVDSQASATEEVEGETRVIERRVTVSAYYVLADEIKTAELRSVLLEQINQWHIGRWVPQRIYLDNDGDIVLESTFNIPGDEYPVHAEIIGDQVLRMNNAWQEFYQEVSTVMESQVAVRSARIASTR
jgi:hypothetical protein